MIERGPDCEAGGHNDVKAISTVKCAKHRSDKKFPEQMQVLFCNEYIQMGYEKTDM